MTQGEWNDGMAAINQQARDVEMQLRAMRDSWNRRLQKIVDGRAASAVDEGRDLRPRPMRSTWSQPI